MPHRNYFKLQSVEDLEFKLAWIRSHARYPKWRWDKRFPKREGRRLGVYLDDQDALAFKMIFSR